ncbi:hypothetical protein [Bradyrhizobium elkanii]|uniref:hypothetical protein n=1 Tax=Bradyrhizobium elkanii TaxID=29448 RepID=UPI0035146432
MEAQQFANKEEFTAHLKAQHGTKFALVATLAAQQKALTRALLGELAEKLAENPMKGLMIVSALQRNVTNVVTALVDFADLHDQATNLLTAADTLVELAEAETKEAKAPTHEAPETQQ